MTSDELLRAVFKKPTPQKVAKHLGLSKALMHRWSRPRGSRGTGALNPLDRIAAIWEFTRDVRLVEWVCRLCGGYFVHNPEVKNGKPKPLSAAENAVVHDFAQMIQLLSKAVQDNAISSEESAHIRERWDKLKSVTEGFVKCCEHGDFQRLQMTVFQTNRNSPAPGPSSSRAMA